MKALTLALGLSWLYSINCGVIKDPEENLTIEAVDNGSIDSFATNALNALNDEELKIVSLLERIQEKFVTLDDGEKVEFVRKISDYQDRFTSTLDKVEEIPGMYNLDVPMLRTNLGIPGPSDTLEEIHDPRDYDEVKLPDATVEIAPDIEATISYEAESLARAAADPTVSSTLEPERSLDDIYEVLTQLVQLVIYQISQEFNKPEPTMPDYYYYPTPSVYMRSSSPFSRVRANKRKKSRKMKPHSRPTPSTMYGGQVPYNQDLAGILNSIPPVYDDVSVHYNYADGRPRFPNKRHRRDTIDEDGIINDRPEDEEAVIDIVDDSEEVNTPVDADIVAEIIARQVAQEYAVWYERTYTPWHNAMMKEVVTKKLRGWVELEEEESSSYIPWFLNEWEEDDESEELMSEEHAEALEQMALYKALLQNEGDDDEGQNSEGDDQSNEEGEGDDQEILDSFNKAMQQLQENYLAMLQTGGDEEQNSIVH